MHADLTFEQLRDLLTSVFHPAGREGELLLLLDLPDTKVPDNPAWADRRTLTIDWYRKLAGHIAELPWSAVRLCVYPNVGSNNGDLPGTMTVVDDTVLQSGGLSGTSRRLDELLSGCSVVLAPTELSATAPLKNLARTIGFRGATLPGFLRSMIPTLALDYEKVNARVMELKIRMDRAESARVRLHSGGRIFESMYDLRYRTAHASGGLMREKGMVGNLPSGEAYIVPYEGEKEGIASNTSGLLPVQFGEEIVIYRIEGNRAIEVLSKGDMSEKEQNLLSEEPAYGNISEVGMGVLGEWGVKAVGSILQDEKLGLHIAFGRSDHFGGITSPTKFNKPENVVHIDRVYVKSSQPLIEVESVLFLYPGGETEKVLEGERYVV